MRQILKSGMIPYSQKQEASESSLILVAVVDWVGGDKETAEIQMRIIPRNDNVRLHRSLAKFKQ